MADLARVAGARWAIEECFQTAKNEAGLDHYQARHYQAWYRHITLAMLATAYLAITRDQEAKKGAAAIDHDQLIHLSSNEIRRLLAHFALTPADCLTHIMAWSRWRRRRQHQPRACHYRRRGHPPS